MMKEIIVIGADHHNTLGVLRSLGEKGINSILLLISENKKSYVAKSKYAKEVHFLTREEERELKNIINEFVKENPFLENHKQLQYL